MRNFFETFLTTDVLYPFSNSNALLSPRVAKNSIGVRKATSPLIGRVFEHLIQIQVRRQRHGRWGQGARNESGESMSLEHGHWYERFHRAKRTRRIRRSYRPRNLFWLTTSPPSWEQGWRTSRMGQTYASIFFSFFLSFGVGRSRSSDRLF